MKILEYLGGGILNGPSAHHFGLRPNNHTIYGWSRLTPRKIPWNFHVDIIIGSVSRKWDQEFGCLEKDEGSWLETWRTGLFLTSWMMFFYPNKDTLKISCWYLNQKCVRKGGSRRGVLGGRWGFLIGDMVDRVILDVMNDVCLPHWRYPESFVLISSLEVVQAWGGLLGPPLCLISKK